MSAIYIQLPDGRAFPVDPRFVLFAGVGEDGGPAYLPIGGSGLKVVAEGGATEARQIQALGQHGWKRFNAGTTEQTDGPWIAIKALTDSVFAVDGDNITGDKTAIPLGAGDTLPGPFTSITRASGDFVAFYADSND